MLDDYARNDTVLSLLRSAERANDGMFTSHRWLLESQPKRMIFSWMYGDLYARDAGHASVLDVGGGYTALTRTLLAKHDYTLLDIMAHCPHEELRRIESEVNRNFWDPRDWLAYEASRTFDYVIANDLFPNVDQRLDLFLTKFLPICRELRLSLTYYNVARWYAVKRIDADEVFHMVAWDGEQTSRALRKHADRVDLAALDKLSENVQSLFPNQRQVACAILKGDVPCV